MFIESDQAFAADGASEREMPRTRVLMKAVLVTAAGSSSVRLRDLSPSGARVMSEVPLLPNSDLLFCKGQARVAARVAWVSCRSAGLFFYRELTRCEARDIFGGQQAAKCAPLQWEPASGEEQCEHG